MNKEPQTRWGYSKATEAARVVFAAAQTANRFYATHGFWVLPKPVKNNPRAVYLPELEYRSVANFWKRAAGSDLGSLTTGTTPLSREVEKLIAEEKLNFEKLRDNWDRVKEQFWQSARKMFPVLVDKNISLTVKPTQYGTGVSFLPNNLRQEKLELIVWLRVDQNLGALAEGILSAIFFQELTKGGYAWEEKEAFVDILLDYSILRELFPGYQGTIAALRSKEQALLARESRKYLQALGVPGGKLIKVRSARGKSEIFIAGKAAVCLSKQEEKLLKLLWEKENQLVSWEMIADCLWAGREDKFSLWAMTKLVERVRGKLRRAGVSPELIQTRRGRGYLLINQ